MQCKTLSTIVTFINQLMQSIVTVIDVKIIFYTVSHSVPNPALFNDSKFEQEYVLCVRNEEESVCSAPNCCDTEQRSVSQPASY